MRDSGCVSGRRLALFAFLSVTLLAGAATAQSAGRGGRSDAAGYAAAMGVPLEEAQRRLAVQLRLGEVESKLNAAAGDVFAGLFIEHQPRFVVRALFTDVARGQELLPLLAAEAGTPIEVGYAAASLRELEALQELSLSRLRAAGIAADADIDLRGNRVVIETAAPAAASRLLPEASAAAGERLAVVPVAELAHLQAILGPLRGGRSLSTCSSGFTAITAGGSVGVLTSGHCGDEQIYWDWDEVLPFGSRQFSGSRDVGFYHRSCQLTVPDEFDSGIGIRQVTGTRSRDQQVIGSVVCRNGASTPYRCGTISSKSFCPSVVPSCSSTFVRVAPMDGQPLSDGGDSGGPWFVETLAYGLHTGKFGSGNDAFYMPINYASTTATVLTAHGGTGYPTGKLTCMGQHGGTSRIYCNASATGGRAPYTYANWFYNGAAETWSFSAATNTIEARYTFEACWAPATNYFSVTLLDACGVAGGAYAYYACPESCLAGSGGDALGPIPPSCSAAGR